MLPNLMAAAVNGLKTLKENVDEDLSYWDGEPTKQLPKGEDMESVVDGRLR